MPTVQPSASECKSWLEIQQLRQRLQREHNEKLLGDRWNRPKRQPREHDLRGCK